MVIPRCWEKEEKKIRIYNLHISNLRTSNEWLLLVTWDRSSYIWNSLKNEFDNIEISQTGREHAWNWPIQIRSHVYDERVWTWYSIGIESKLFEIISCPIKILPYRKYFGKRCAFLARIVNYNNNRRDWTKVLWNWNHNW